jgi:L-asparagine transporter-like permease
MAVILCLYPWQKLQSNVSPFVDVFDKIGFHFAAQLMSIVVITAALSAFNSCLYAGARMLANLARHNSAPAYLSKADRDQVPKNAVITTSIVIALTVILNYLLPENAITYLIAITTTSIIITWTTILICHTGFRRHVDSNDVHYQLPFFPYANLFAFFVLAAVVVIMFFMPEMQIAVFLMPVWIGSLSLLYIVNKKINQKI